MGQYHYVAAEVPFFGGLKKLQHQIPDESLYVAEPGFGRENSPHITLLYGLHDENDFFTIRRILQQFKNIPVKLMKISKFTADNYDVIKIDVESDVCHEIYSKIKEECENTQTYDSYHPHVTLAYVLPWIS